MDDRKPILSPGGVVEMSTLTSSRSGGGGDPQARADDPSNARFGGATAGYTYAVMPPPRVATSGVAVAVPIGPYASPPPPQGAPPFTTVAGIPVSDSAGHAGVPVGTPVAAGTVYREGPSHARMADALPADATTTIIYAYPPEMAAAAQPQQGLVNDDIMCPVVGLVLGLFFPIAGWVTACIVLGTRNSSVRRRRLGIAAAVLATISFVIGMAMSRKSQEY